MSEGTRDRGAGGRPGRINTESVYAGRIVNLNIDTVRFPDGREGRLEIIRHVGAAAALPFAGQLTEADPDVFLLRQYRYATGGYLYEVPAGLPLGPDESWEDCARRELEEETGMRAGSLIPLTTIYTTPGFTDEVIHLFAATDLEPGDTELDDDEFIEVVRFPFSVALEMVREGLIRDAKSISTILYADRFLMNEAQRAS